MTLISASILNYHDMSTLELERLAQNITNSRTSAEVADLQSMKNKEICYIGSILSSRECGSLARN